MAKAVFISGDGWLSVFDLLPPSQLGLGIAMISHRFDYYVDEHFKTRKWALKFIEIRSKIGENGTKEMEIGNCSGKLLPIPQIQLPRKVTGFEQLIIAFIDRNAIAFLHRFRPLFASCQINLTINTDSERVLELILHNIWPLLGKNIYGIELPARTFRCIRKFAPSILRDYPSLRVFTFNSPDLHTEFPCDDSANASDGQAMAKWLFTPHPNNVPKVLRCSLEMNDGNLASKIEAFKTAFANASSPVNFIVVICSPTSFVDSALPFDQNQTNELTREQLVLKRTNYSNYFLLVRCPIARDASKWAKCEKEAIDWRIYYQRNRIYIHISRENEIGDGLLDATLGPNDQ